MLGKTGVSRAENRYFRGKNMKKGTGFLTLFGGAVALYALLAAPVPEGTGDGDRLRTVSISAIFMWAA